MLADSAACEFARRQSKRGDQPIEEEEEDATAVSRSGCGCGFRRHDLATGTGRASVLTALYPAREVQQRMEARIDEERMFVVRLLPERVMWGLFFFGLAGRLRALSAQGFARSAGNVFCCVCSVLIFYFGCDRGGNESKAFPDSSGTDPPIAERRASTSQVGLKRRAIATNFEPYLQAMIFWYIEELCQQCEFDASRFGCIDLLP
jgi:hypothetical protein